MPDRPPRAAHLRRPARLAVSVALDGARPRVSRTRVNRTRVNRTPVSRAALEGLAVFVLRAEKVRDALLSIALVTPRAIAALNRKHLGHSGPTDVIAFGLKPHVPRLRSPVIGDIYICPDVAGVNAVRHGVSRREELQRLVVHGTLHVLGWDHPDGAERERTAMWARQEQLLRTWQRRRTAR
jgi:probable rRNA maturation factor